MIFGCSACLTAALALARNESNALRAVELEERIEVVGTAVDAVEAVRTTTLAGGALAALPIETLSEALAELPGLVTLFDSPFGGSPMVIARGFFGGGEVDYVGLEVDGTPRQESESGLADWRSFRLAGTERIELLPGPAMRRGGVDPALAGRVRVVSRALAEAPQGASPTAASAGMASISLSSFDSRAASARWTATDGDWSATADGFVGTTAGYREHAAASDQTVAIALDRRGDLGTWGFSASGRRSDREEPGPLAEDELAEDPLASNPRFADDRERSKRWGCGVRWTGSSARRPLEARLVADGRSSHFVRTLLLMEGFGDRAVREVRTEGVGVGLATPTEIPLGRRAGLRYSAGYRGDNVRTAYSHFESGAQKAFDRAHRDRWSGEVGLALRPVSRLEIDLSLRGDWIGDRSELQGASRQQATSPRVGLVWSAVAVSERSLELFAELSRAFKAPTLDQLYDPRPLPGPDGEFTLSNPALEPQRTRGWELGARARLRGAQGRIALYRLQVEHEIDFDPATFRYSNIGRSRHEGIEISTEWDLERFGQLRISGALAIAEAEGRAPSGQLKNVPREVVRLAWSVRLPGAVDLGLRQAYLGKRWADDANHRPLEDVLRTDLRLARDIGGVRLRLDVLNLFDQDALELAYLLPDASGEGVVLHGFAPVPRAFRVSVERNW